VIQGENYTCRGGWTLRGTNVQFGADGCAGAMTFDPLLDRNGLPRAGSLLINAADPAFCLANDIDGTTRPQGGQCDVGAFELSIASAPIVIVTPLPTFTPEPTATLIPVPTLPPPTPRPQFDCRRRVPNSIAVASSRLPPWMVYRMVWRPSIGIRHKGQLITAF